MTTILSAHYPWWALAVSGLLVLAGCLALYLASRRKWQAALRRSQGEHEQALLSLERDCEKQIETVTSQANARADAAVRDANNRVQDIMKQSRDAIAMEQEQNKRSLQRAREAIESEKATLLGMSAQELMVSAVMALNGYGTRLDRLEDSLKGLNGKAQEQAANMTTLRKNLNTAYDAMYERMNGLSPALAAINAGVNSLRISNESLLEKLDDADSLVKQETSALASSLDAIQSTTRGIQGYSSMESLTDIASSLGAIKSTLDEIRGYSSLASLTDIASDIEDIKSKLRI